MYGTILWCLRSKGVKRVFSSWKTGIKLAWGVHRGCRTYLLQSVLAPGQCSMRARVITGFLGFFQSLLTGPSMEVSIAARLASRDVRSNIGSNIAMIREETGLDPWHVEKHVLKSILMIKERDIPPEEDKWRAPYLARLLDERLFQHYQSNKEEESRLSDLINSLVIN